MGPNGDLPDQFEAHPRADYIADAVRPVNENVAAIVALVKSAGRPDR
jgi:hypothetical protein